MGYYRGEAKDYGNTSCRPSIYRVIGNLFGGLDEERKYYREVKELTEEYAIIEQVKDKKEDVRLAYELAIFQHYGFATRLLDITTDESVARYFACCSHFRETGYVFRLENEKEYKNIDIESIKRKLKLIDYNCDAFLDVKAVLGDSGRPFTIEGNVIIDKTIYEEIKFENLRQKRQSGKFVLFGNKVKDGKILGVFTKTTFNINEEIPAQEKIRHLIKLNKEGVNYVRLFPDDSLSVTIQAQYLKMKNNKLSEDILSPIIEEEKVVKKVMQILLNFKQEIDENKFYFIMKEIVDYIRENGVENCQVEGIVKQLIGDVNI